MKKKTINRKKLFVKAIEDTLKKSIELAFIGLIVGISLNLLAITLIGVAGGSLYFQNNQNSFFGEINMKTKKINEKQREKK